MAPRVIPEVPASEILFVAFDTETTGLTPAVDRIVEIGAVRFGDGKVLDAFEELIDPGIPVSLDAFAVNGISDDMVRGKPTVEEVLPRFLDFLQGAVPIAHNAPFDAGFLSYDISRLKLEAPEEPILDTCAIPKQVFPGFPSYSLGNLAAALGIVPEGLHRALADAKACMEIFGKCVNEMGGPDVVTLGQLLEANGPSVRLGSGEIVLEPQLLPLKKALDGNGAVDIVYRNAQGTLSARQITPLTIGVFRGTAMIEAYCHLRKEKRHFRLDRIVECK